MLVSNVDWSLVTSIASGQTGYWAGTATEKPATEAVSQALTTAAATHATGSLLLMISQEISSYGWTPSQSPVFADQPVDTREIEDTQN